MSKKEEKRQNIYDYFSAINYGSFFYMKDAGEAEDGNEKKHSFIFWCWQYLKHIEYESKKLKKNMKNI